MDVVSRYFQKYREVYGQEHRNFTNTFGVGLITYWDNFTGFDIVKFDEEFIKPPDGESMEDVIQKEYGDEGVRIIRVLLLIGGK